MKSMCYLQFHQPPQFAEAAIWQLLYLILRELQPLEVSEVGEDIGGHSFDSVVTEVAVTANI